MHARKSGQARDKIIKNANGQILHECQEVRKRWTENFEQVMNVNNVRKACIHIDGSFSIKDSCVGRIE